MVIFHFSEIYAELDRIQTKTVIFGQNPKDIWIPTKNFINLETLNNLIKI